MIENYTFESSVNSYGRQTAIVLAFKASTFESSVNSYGRQTFCHSGKCRL